MSDASLQLAGPVGALEAKLEFPDAGVARRAGCAIVCHPLPTDGGTMDNKVVTTTARALRELGITTLRFNFRGTGQSAGHFDGGAGERDDLRAVADWLRASRPDDVLWLAGFSFGSYVSLRMNGELAPAALISIAPPVGRWEFDQVPTPPMPWLVVQGTADEIVDPQAVARWFAGLGAPQGALVELPETSHFFHRKLIDLRQVLQHWAQPLLPPVA
ncbi:alpha/beta hydrolase [Solilutibacter silvestris]|uniref:Putative hydrolase of the alpha/beta superfamily n=1 Tax=Solilutibacter silvestris TaxID=1645665 RepID=A0A2K1Q1C5_9GAMM|nr:alpha/beta family hydrolase [Lysobacter silvestris]PNS08824.1 putative hydrolase of the alpha/beta superfamily [Lysobacter silvestris]